MLVGDAGRGAGYLLVVPAPQVLGKLVQLIPVFLERFCDLVCCLGCPQLENGIVIERPILSHFVFTPDLLALNAEDLHANASRSRDVVGNELGSERGVAHDHIVLARLREHALGEMLGEVVVYLELADDALPHDGQQERRDGGDHLHLAS